ncbi:MAG: hypothetical protein RLY78_740 [Pseudomonadota bacterium]|jgi:hypothetical protein
MSTRLSAAAARITALGAEALQARPSVTSWSRLEPLPVADDIALGLQAPLADPLWLLARQWQFNELRGEDAGSPVAADVRVHGLPLRTLLPPGGAPQPLDDAQAPIEALVEGERVLGAHPKLNAQAGQQLLRLLRAAGQRAAIGPLLRDWPAVLAAPSDAASDVRGFVWHQLLDGRSVDAAALSAAWRDVHADAAAAAAWLAAHDLDAAALPPLLDRWLRWIDALALDPRSDSGASPCWQPARLDYAFGLGTAGTSPAAQIQAAAYTDGRLDWDDFTATRLPAAGWAADPSPTHAGPRPAVLHVSPGRALMPAQARWPGMPADRHWSFEDGRVNFGAIGAGRGDLARLALLEYALAWGHDWYVLPLTLPVQSLWQVGRLTVRDNFGLGVEIPPARNPDGTPWSLYALSRQGPAAASGGGDPLYLCPSLQAQEGPPLEQVLLMRDEMANLAWAIEQRVQGSSGDPLDRRDEAARLSVLQSVRGGGAGGLVHRLQTPVAPHWIPFLPVRRPGATPQQWSIQLQRGVVVQHLPVDAARLADPRQADLAAVIARLRAAPWVQAEPEQAGLQGFAFHPRGEILRERPATGAAGLATDFLRLDDETVPRAGIELRRAFNYARDARGRALLWIGRSKTTGRGEGASGLRFDAVERSGG